jgi:hypothetical protein
MPVTNQGQLDMNLSWGVGFTSRDVAEVGELPKPIVRAPNATATVHVPVRGDAGISDSSMPVEYAKHRPQGSRRTAGRTPARRTLGETPLARSLPPCARRRGAPRPRSVACPSRSAQPFRPPALLVARCGPRIPSSGRASRYPITGAGLGNLPRPPRSARTPQDASVRAASRSCRGTPSRCRTPRA